MFIYLLLFNILADKKVEEFQKVDSASAQELNEQSDEAKLKRKIAWYDIVICLVSSVAIDRFWLNKAWKERLFLMHSNNKSLEDDLQTKYHDFAQKGWQYFILKGKQTCGLKSIFDAHIAKNACAVFSLKVPPDTSSYTVTSSDYKDPKDYDEYKKRLNLYYYYSSCHVNISSTCTYGFLHKLSLDNFYSQILNRAHFEDPNNGNYEKYVDLFHEKPVDDVIKDMSEFYVQADQQQQQRGQAVQVDEKQENLQINFWLLGNIKRYCDEKRSKRIFELYLRVQQPSTENIKKEIKKYKNVSWKLHVYLINEVRKEFEPVLEKHGYLFWINYFNYVTFGVALISVFILYLIFKPLVIKGCKKIHNWFYKSSENIKAEEEILNLNEKTV